MYYDNKQLYIYICVMTLGILRLISSKKASDVVFLLNGEKNSVCIVMYR